MWHSKGFTLIELIVVLVILSVTAVIAIPSYVTTMERNLYAQAEQELLVIYGAQMNYASNNGGVYCMDRDADAAKWCDTTAKINTNLNLNIIANGFDYFCKAPAQGSFGCWAQRVGKTPKAYFSLIIDSNFPVSKFDLGKGVGNSTKNPVCESKNTPSFCPNGNDPIPGAFQLK